MELETIFNFLYVSTILGTVGVMIHIMFRDTSDFATGIEEEENDSNE